MNGGGAGARDLGGRLRRLRRITSGKRGRLIVVEDACRDGRPLVWKVRRVCSRDPRPLEREFDATISSHHPNLVKALEMGGGTRTRWLLREYVAGCPLSTPGGRPEQDLALGGSAPGRRRYAHGRPSNAQPPAIAVKLTSVAATALLLASSCSNQPGQPATVAESGGSKTPAQSNPHAGLSIDAAARADGALAGAVVETMDAGGYTYARLDTAQGEVWVAGPATPLAVGQAIEARNPQPMPGFHSASLDRTFEMIYFASGLAAGGGAPAGAAHGSTEAPAGAQVSSAVARAEGGQTVEELITGKDQWVGKEILLRAEVVKYTADVMGKNWLHVQDGSGGEGTNDLTITTSATAAVGDTVLIRGTLIADKDFGFGYAYDLIIEDAAVTVEAD